MLSKKESKKIFEEEKELSLSALDFLNTNDNASLIQLHKDSEINIYNEGDWNFLPTLPPKMNQKIRQTFIASKLSEKYLDFLIKSQDNYSNIDLRINIIFDTNEFKALTLKIYKLCSLAVELILKWKNYFKIKLENQKDEEDFAKFLKFLAILSNQSQTKKNTEMNKRFYFNMKKFYN